MDPTHTLFSAALGLQEPWKIENVNFDSDNGQLTLELGFERGAKFPDPELIRIRFFKEFLPVPRSYRD
jgi:hypothetical protein